MAIPSRYELPQYAQQPVWESSFKETEERLKKFLPENTEQVSAGLAKCALTFENHLPRTLAPQFNEQYNQRPHNCQGHQTRNYFIFNDPYFWLRHSYPNSVSNSSNQSYNANLGGFPRRVNTQQTEKDKNKEKFYLAIAVVFLVASDIIAVSAAIYQIVKSSRIALNFRKISVDFANIRQELRTATVQVEGRDDRHARQALKDIGNMASRIANREYRFQALRTTSIAIVSASAVGAVHALVCSIACACLKETMATAVSADLLSFYSFATASCSAPFLFAVGTIFMVGCLVYLAAKALNAKRYYEADARKGKEAFDALNNAAITESKEPQPTERKQEGNPTAGCTFDQAQPGSSEASAPPGEPLNTEVNDNLGRTDGVEGQPAYSTSFQTPSAPEPGEI
jgi:predicted phage tail protein